jgi:hypothetical protein
MIDYCNYIQDRKMALDNKLHLLEVTLCWIINIICSATEMFSISDSWQFLELR